MNAKMNAIQVEAMFLGWNDSHTGGPKIMLQLPGSEELDHFKLMTVRKGRGKTAVAGQRLMCVFVEIDDQEMPLSATPAMPAKAAEAATSEKPAGAKGGFPLGLTGLAVKWCLDPAFQKWAIARYPEFMPLSQWDDEETAKQIICYACHIKSRKELDLDRAAGETFKRKIRDPYMVYLGESNG